MSEYPLKFMADNKRVPILEGLTADILTSIGHVAGVRPAAFEGATDEIKSLSSRDYRPALRQLMSRCEVQEIIAAGKRRVWPDLNREPVRIGGPQEFTSRWSSLGVDFRLARISSPHGLALMGFYVRKAPASKRPLICVNTAHHPAAMGAAFSHEMGHHVTAEIFGSHKEPARFLLYTGYAEHLEDPVELAADILVSVGVFPAKTARALLGTLGKGQQAEREDQASAKPSLAKVLNYFDRRYGLSFGARLSAQRKFQYLAGVIHYAQLRRALLDEYGL